MATVKKNDPTIPATDIKLVQCKFGIRGTSPLISHAWSKKAKEMLLAKQVAPKTSKKEPRDPDRDFRESMYYIHGDPHTPLENCVFGMPAISFKCAAVNACSQIDGVTKVFARSVFHVGSTFEATELVPIYSEDGPIMRDDMVRVGMGTADIRFRAMFPTWETELLLKFNESATSLDQVITLMNIAGFGVGVGDYRPERNGTFGTFEVTSVEVLGNIQQKHNIEIVDRRKMAA